MKHWVCHHFKGQQGTRVHVPLGWKHELCPSKQRYYLRVYPVCIFLSCLCCHTGCFIFTSLVRPTLFISTGIKGCRRRTFHQLCAIRSLLLGGGSAAGAQCWGLLPAIRGNSCMVEVARGPHCSLLPPGLEDAACCV